MEAPSGDHVRLREWMGGVNRYAKSIGIRPPMRMIHVDDVVWVQWWSRKWKPLWQEGLDVEQAVHLMVLDCARNEEQYRQFNPWFDPEEGEGSEHVHGVVP